MAFLYETHLHTQESSLCGIAPAREYIRYYQDRGYQGIFVTDHFFRGNSNINRKLPWKEWVSQFCRGYENALEEGEKRGLDVFFGWEEAFDGDEYLIYGLDKGWILDHPRAKSWSRKEQFDAVSDAGGCVVQAHPFRQRAYISTIHLSTGCVHAVEAANACNDAPDDALAMRYAKRLNLPVTAGSDIHSTTRPNFTTIGVSFETKLRSAADFARRMRGGEQPALILPPTRCDWIGDEAVTLPVDIRDADDRSAGRDIKRLLSGALSCGTVPHGTTGLMR